MVDQVTEIKGTARIITGEDATFEDVRYRIALIEQGGRGRRSVLQGTIEAEPRVLLAIARLGESAIDLGDLGCFGSHVIEHLLAATPTAHWLEYVDWADGILEEPLRIAEGAVVGTDRPGLGIAWDEAKLKRLEAL
jgi:hypothetical protein